jgi:mRNA interferase MazF
MAADRVALEAGDILLVDFDPSIGHEQRGVRPALVVSEGAYNAVSSFVLVCPITTSDRPWPFKVAVTGERVTGFVLVDQVKAIDRARLLRPFDRCDRATLSAARARLGAVLGFENF